MSLIQVMPELIASLKLELEQLYVKTVFLHGDLEEEICMDNWKDLRRLERSNGLHIEESI